MSQRLEYLQKTHCIPSLLLLVCRFINYTMFARLASYTLAIWNAQSTSFATRGIRICTLLFLIFKILKKDADEASLGSLPILIGSGNRGD